VREQGKDNPDLWMASMSLLNAANYFSQKAPKEPDVGDKKLIEMMCESKAKTIPIYGWLLCRC
jgi:hypothetical protein